MALTRPSRSSGSSQLDLWYWTEDRMFIFHGRSEHTVFIYLKKNNKLTFQYHHMCCRTPFGCRPGSSPPPMFHCVALVAWQPLQRLWSKASCNAAQSVSSPRWWWDTGQWRPKPRKPQCSPAWCGACMRCSVYSPWCRPPAKREKPEKKGENDTWPICTSVPLGFHPCLKSRFILLSAHHWRGSGKGVTIKQTWQHPSFFPEWRWERSGDWGGGSITDFCSLLPPVCLLTAALPLAFVPTNCNPASPGLLLLLLRSFGGSPAPCRVLASSCTSVPPWSCCPAPGSVLSCQVATGQPGVSGEAEYAFC